MPQQGDAMKKSLLNIILGFLMTFCSCAKDAAQETTRVDPIKQPQQEAHLPPSQPTSALVAGKTKVQPTAAPANIPARLTPPRETQTKNPPKEKTIAKPVPATSKPKPAVQAQPSPLKPQTPVKQKPPPGKREVHYANVDQERLKKESLCYLQGEDKPFTGKTFKVYQTGNRSVEVDYMEGKANGFLTQYYQGGQKRFQVPMKDNKANGLAVGWYPNGKMKSEYPYIDGVVHGTFSEWFESGQISLQANYIRGKLRGSINGWYLDGSSYKIGEILNDEAKRITAWYEPGSKWKEIGWRNGKLWGYYYEWNQHGDLMTVKSYKNGKLVKAIK